MFYKNVLSPFIENIGKFGERNSFCVNNKFYTYKDLGECISKIRSELGRTDFHNNKVGLAVNDDLETYASIFALWLEGCSYVPLHPNWPKERCMDICEQVELDLVLDSSAVSRYEEIKVISTTSLHYNGDNLCPKDNVDDDELAYILFTSGSTGKPKGVQLSRKNLASFINAFFAIYSIDENDRCLQCFDLTFDLSISSYLTPLLKGACVYTVSSDGIKYSYIAGLIEDEHLTFALMAPSTIKYLRPYFNEIDCSSLKYSLFCGEALPLDITEEWSQCAQNAIIDNVYGPTEDTIFCSTYRYERTGGNKTHNGILSIGKPMLNCGMVIFDDQNNECSIKVMGELCLSGPQLTKGYHKNEKKNRESFFEKDGVVWYRSGDLCYKDSEGDILYSGRLDHQVKIQGFRVEMGEIEYHSKEYLHGTSVVALAFENVKGITEIALFIESNDFDTKPLLDYLRTKMPHYMIPAHFYFVPKFPLNSNGKTDKVVLKSLIKL